MLYHFILSLLEHSNSPRGRISWRFRITEPGMTFRAVKLSLLASTFHPSAKVVVTLADDNGCTQTILGDDK
jgi:hypothetical protein